MASDKITQTSNRAESAASPPKGKPLLFGDPVPDAERMEQARFLRHKWDRSYVPVYSERQVENEIRVKDGLDPIPGPRLIWLPISNLDGSNVDGMRLSPYTMLGYTWMTKQHLDHYGFGMPPAAHLAEDGTIRREDSALAFVNADIADLNRKHRREDLDEARGSINNSSDGIDVVEEKSGRANLLDIYDKLS